MSDNNAPDSKPMLVDRIRALDDEKWKLVQTIGGIVLGLGVAACLFLIPDSGGFLPLNFIGAAALAMFVPRYIENRLERKIDRGRTVLVIMLGVCVLAYLGYVLAVHGVDSIFTKK